MRGDKYVIRPFEPSDLEAFCQQVGQLVPKSIPGPAFTCLCEGKVIGSAGIVPKHPGVGEAWILLTQDALLHGLVVARHTKRGLARLMEEGGYRRVQITIEHGQDDLIGWMHFLGFQIEGIMRKYGRDGADHYLCARLNGG